MYVLESSNPLKISEAEAIINKMAEDKIFVSVNGVTFNDVIEITLIDHRESAEGDDCTLTVYLKEGEYATVSFDPESQKIIANTVYSETNALIITVEDRNLIEEAMP